MTARIIDFLNTRRPDGPCLVVDLDVVRENYLTFAHALPDTRIFYAVKANPAPEVLRLLASLGSCFDCASVAEIDMALAAGATPDRISYGNTIKKERDIAAPSSAASRSFGRLRSRSREGCARRSRHARLLPHPLSTAPAPNGRCRASSAASPKWRSACSSMRIASASSPMASRSMSARSRATPKPGTARSRRPPASSATLAERGIQLSMVNLGGGFPTRYLKDVPGVESYGSSIDQALKRHFGNRIPETIIEPGRGMVGNAGIIKSEVVLISKKSDARTIRAGSISTSASSAASPRRWTSRSATRSARRHDGDATAPCILAGPTCDSADVLYEKTPYNLPVTLSIGDEVLIEGTGAYTTTYSAVAFNGFEPLASYVI